MKKAEQWAPQASKRIAAQRKAARTGVPERSMSRSTSRSRRRRSGVRGRQGLAVTTTPVCSIARLGQWGLRGQRGGRRDRPTKIVETEGRPRLRYCWTAVLGGILRRRGVQLFPAVSRSNDIVVLTEPKPTPRCATGFTSAPARSVLCVPISSARGWRGGGDVLPFQLVTMGQPIADS